MKKQEPQFFLSPGALKLLAGRDLRPLVVAHAKRLRAGKLTTTFALVSPVAAELLPSVGISVVATEAERTKWKRPWPIEEDGEPIVYFLNVDERTSPSAQLPRIRTRARRPRNSGTKSHE